MTHAARPCCHLALPGQTNDLYTSLACSLVSKPGKFTLQRIFRGGFEAPAGGQTRCRESPAGRFRVHVRAAIPPRCIRKGHDSTAIFTASKPVAYSRTGKRWLVPGCSPMTKVGRAVDPSRRGEGFLPAAELAAPARPVRVVDLSGSSEIGIMIALLDESLAPRLRRLPRASASRSK